MSGGWLRELADGTLVLTLHVCPQARRTGFGSLHGGAIKLHLAAPPVEGKANAALCAFLADFCEVPRTSVRLLSGHATRAKRVRIEPPGEAVLARLHALAAHD